MGRPRDSGHEHCLRNAEAAAAGTNFAGEKVYNKLGE